MYSLSFGFTVFTEKHRRSRQRRGSAIWWGEPKQRPYRKWSEYRVGVWRFIYSYTKFFVHEDVIFNAVKYFKNISRQEEDYFNFWNWIFSLCRCYGWHVWKLEFLHQYFIFFLFFAQHKHKQFLEMLEHYRFNLLYMFNLSYFTEAILKNRTLTDAKKREQFTILKKQMEMDLMVKSMHVIYTNHFCHALNWDNVSGCVLQKL